MLNAIKAIQESNMLGSVSLLRLKNIGSDISAKLSAISIFFSNPITKITIPIVTFLTFLLCFHFLPNCGKNS